MRLLQVFHLFFNIFVSSVKFIDLHTVDPSLFYLESEGGTDHVEALDSCGSGVDGEHVESFVPCDLEDVGMAAYEDVGTMEVDEGIGSGIVTARIAPDMGHQHLHPFAFEYPVEGMDESEIVVVAIARHAFQRLELTYLLSQFESSSEVSGMPYFIDRLEEFTELRVEYSVCVRYYSYIHVICRLNFSATAKLLSLSGFLNLDYGTFLFP